VKNLPTTCLSLSPSVTSLAGPRFVPTHLDGREITRSGTQTAEAREREKERERKRERERG